ncbi:hypothetical protein [Flavobacterium sp.]|uniref:hypothetical protein n=1 Tax=Flavobacterium sp. TaxID=239 RepID=UPI003D0C6C36
MVHSLTSESMTGYKWKLYQHAGFLELKWFRNTEVRIGERTSLDQIFMEKWK